MDRELSSGERRAGAVRRTAPVVGAVVAVAAVAWSLPSLLTPSVPRESVRIATVERGSVTTVIEASGTVEPASERVVSSPIDARVLRVVRRPGGRVAADDVLVELDDASARDELARLTDAVETLELERRQAALDLERSTADLAARARSRALERDVASSRLARWDRLRAEGLASEEQMEERRLELRRAEIDAESLGSAAASSERAAGARLAALDLAIVQAERAVAEQQRLVDLAGARAGFDGVVTWVHEDAGATVTRGEPLARIASLDAYRVVARVSEMAAPRLGAGLPVRVRAPGLDVRGTVAGVRPAVSNGVLSFDVTLDEPSHPSLRPSMRVDAWVTTAEKQDVLRIARPAGVASASRAELFVVRGNEALRKAIDIGLAGPDFAEVAAGASEGDEIIVSDVTTWAGAKALRLK